MGALRLSQLCADLEARSRDAFPDDAAARTSHIAGEHVRVERVFTARRQQLSTPPQT